MNVVWDPVTYLQYDHERGRSFDELIARVHVDAPMTVVDLGCGPGGRTAALLERWPMARVVGVDSSVEMVEAAQRHVVDGRLSFVTADLREWEPVCPVDVLVANATLQWVPDHLELLPRLVDWLAPDGWLAFQVPGNFAEPSHRLLQEMRESSRWRGRVGVGASGRSAVHQPAAYLAVLAGLGLDVDAWETTYLHVLSGDDAVLEWTKGTALRPVLMKLDQAEREEFFAEYGALLRSAYPQQECGTLFPFRRIFIVAHLPRPAGGVSTRARDAVGG
ncbi:MAG: methyltransferase domain-containing protein [Candidatus Dormibacteraeota bacterium]|uniref:Trans-aconitate 2-methyltransferase n=1 Tax=Candidatus Amunia macphersoniae TaxID=3127014 RepID=A0A934KF22_9BACT|nr:methyltransferase domain-containing protein [Candidatus Dormibacteraeota bacterium]